MHIVYHILSILHVNFVNCVSYDSTFASTFIFLILIYAIVIYRLRVMWISHL